MKQSNKASIVKGLRGALLLAFVIALSFSGIFQPVSVSAQNTATAAPHHVYLPSIVSVSNLDLRITRIEVTQAVQDGSNSIPLVAGKPTMLRIYTKDSGFSQAPSNVRVMVTASSANNGLAASPQAFAASVPLSSTQANYQSTINYRLPSNWTSGTVDVNVKLDADNKIAEYNESNNGISVHLVFNNIPPLKVVIVPIQYTSTVDGHTYPGPSKDTISDWILRTYPVSSVQISWHAPYAFRGNLSTSNDFNTLLNDITSLKQNENPPAATVYYGLIPTNDGTRSWFNGGIAGVGWISERAAVGLDYSGQSSQIAAHEIGHNLGMMHTPCGNAADPDPKYPYADGSIGQYGLDVSTGHIYPPSTKDVMTYCDPKWISDYTYKELYNNQRQLGMDMINTLVAPDSSIALSQRKLLVRANITSGKVAFLPAYVMSGTSENAPEGGEYQVQVLGLHDETLVQVPVRGYTAGEDGDSAFTGIHALIPLPAQPAAKVRLLKDGKVLAEQSLQSITMDKVPGVTAEKTAAGYHLRWAAAQQPVMVRYSSDGGKTWTILGMDMTGSEMTIPSTSLAVQDDTFEVIPAGTWR